jgi:hypothetical protein
MIKSAREMSIDNVENFRSGVPETSPSYSADLGAMARKSARLEYLERRS